MARYTPEFMESLRHAYEETDEPTPSIATNHKIGLRTVYRIGEREGWRRRTDRERALPAAQRLLNEAEALVARVAAEAVAPAADIVPAEAPLPQREAVLPAPPVAETDATAAMLARIEALIGKELAAEEIARQRLGTQPRSRADAERTARTLATLTRTLQTIHGMHAAPRDWRNDDDDMPTDIDAFRCELARRIDAFVESWATAEAENAAQAQEALPPASPDGGSVQDLGG